MHSMKRRGFMKFAGVGTRTLLLALALTVSLLSATGTTLAWLGDSSEKVVNTFTYGGISIDIAETPTQDGDEDEHTNSYLITPGKPISKDPTVTVHAGSEDCWLYVVIEESDNFGQYMTYALAEGWTAVEGAPGVYARLVKYSDDDQTFAVLRDNEVQVLASVTGEQLFALTQTGAQLPTLSFYAAAVQYCAEIAELSDAKTAWEAYMSEPLL